jgi:coronin-1B/1C/6
VIVGRHDRPGRYDSSCSQSVTGHSGAVLDMDWSPFDDSMMATGSEDTQIKLWQIPEDWEPTDEKGIGKKGEDLKNSILDLEGHNKKVSLLRFHPTANNVLLSSSADYTCKVWDIEAGSEVSTLKGLTDLVQDIVWDVRGDTYATSNKDKALRLVDGRTGKEKAKVPMVHEGAKSVKIQFMGETGKFLTTGASKQSGREIKVWDIKNLSKPIKVEAVDTASGAMIPLYDQDTEVLYLCGKGDGIIRLYEFEESEPFIVKMNDGFRSTIPGKGYCMVPKRGLDIMGCETVRIMKLTNNEGVQPLQFIVPRKSDAFQDDIFPDTASLTPAHTCAEWVGGSSKLPVTECLDPAKGGNKSRSGGGGAPKKVLKTVPMMKKEVDVLTERVKYLEGKLKAAGVSY